MSEIGIYQQELYVPIESRSPMVSKSGLLLAAFSALSTIAGSAEDPRVRGD